MARAVLLIEAKCIGAQLFHERALGADLCAYDVVNGGLVIAESGVLEQVAARVANKTTDGGEG